MMPLRTRAAAALSLALALLIPALTTAFVVLDREELAARALPVDLDPIPPPFSAVTVSEDVLWLARCIYSETKQPHEQELVAWVVRNRVETEYRGQSTYRDVVLDPYQFSAFNPGSAVRRHYLHLEPASPARGWLRALEVAHEVYYAQGDDRPFAVETRHFYSERSMRGGRTPNWAQGQAPVRLTGIRVDPRRFRFFANVS